ncbi:MAG: hypothetical protein EAZ89_03570, partial [Bacteroidetes bacterium]
MAFSRINVSNKKRTSTLRRKFFPVMAATLLLSLGFQAHRSADAHAKAASILAVAPDALVAAPADTLCEEAETIDPQVLRAANYQCLELVHDEALFAEGWDTLAQPKFWQRVMTLSPDSSVVNVARTRSMLGTIATGAWDSWSYRRQNAFKDSVRAAHNLSGGEVVFITAGKNHYYKLDKTIGSIGQATEIFRQAGVDPWFAQAILLIESPGANNTSHVGAYGAFQLMKGIAKNYGLVVSNHLDERGDLAKAAKAAAGYIGDVCVPETRALLRARGMNVSEESPAFRLMVLHAYHAGIGNVEKASRRISYTADCRELVLQL